MQLRNRHEWVCGPTTSERSDWRRLAHPEMAVCEGEFPSRLTLSCGLKNLSGEVMREQALQVFTRPSHQMR